MSHVFSDEKSLFFSELARRLLVDLRPLRPHRAHRHSALDYPVAHKCLSPLVFSCLQKLPDRPDIDKHLCDQTDPFDHPNAKSYACLFKHLGPKSGIATDRGWLDRQIVAIKGVKFAAPAPARSGGRSQTTRRRRRPPRQKLARKGKGPAPAGRGPGTARQDLRSPRHPRPGRSLTDRRTYAADGSPPGSQSRTGRDPGALS